MLKKVENYIVDHKLISKGDRIVVGVSGGADSVCLFHVLRQLISPYQLSLFVVHVNHGIRGGDAFEDENFVRELCNQYQIPFSVVHADVPAIARNQGLTEEEAGRNVRYQAFSACCEKNMCNKVAIAHNKNDNAETILFHLFRGSGIKGLTGISAVRGTIIRPLLCVTREQIESYLEQNNMDYRTDITNLSEDYSRNKIRHRIISFAKEKINPKSVEHIVNAANQLREINEYLEKNIEIAFWKVVSKQNQESYLLDITALSLEEPVIQKGIIRKVYELLADQLKDVDALHIKLILDLAKKEVGKSLNLPYQIEAVKGYTTITMRRNVLLEPNESDNLTKLEQVITIPGEYYVPQSQKIIRANLLDYKKSMKIPKNGCTKWFDYDKIKNTVMLRGRREGDFIQIDSQGNTKKLKSLFIDNKVPREQRDRIPLVADGKHIMWIVGDRISEAYKVSEDTKVILEISIDGGQKNE
jgi:tRNA(Ile)-lysidine synthase